MWLAGMIHNVDMSSWQPVCPCKVSEIVGRMTQEPDNRPAGSLGSEHRRGAVAVILREDRFLVIRRSRHVVAPRAFCFPGGGIEAGESEQQALVREIREELGVAVEAKRRVWSSVTPWNVRLSWWLAEIGPHEIPEPTPAEVESVHWCSQQEMRKLPGLLSSNHHFLDALERNEFRLA